MPHAEIAELGSVRAGPGRERARWSSRRPALKGADHGGRGRGPRDARGSGRARAPLPVAAAGRRRPVAAPTGRRSRRRPSASSAPRPEPAWAPGSCGSRPSSPSRCSVAGTCCSRASSSALETLRAERRRRARRRRPARVVDRGPDRRRAAAARPASPRSRATARSASRCSDLPATSGDQVYEAWVIGGDGVPVPLGGFQVGADGRRLLRGRRPADRGGDRAGAHAGARPGRDGAVVGAGLAGTAVAG